MEHSFSALSPQAITANQLCHAEEIGNNVTLRLNAGTTPTLPVFRGVCFSKCLPAVEQEIKIACREKDSWFTKCVNESSTAAFCYNNTIYIAFKKYPNGTYEISVTGPKGLIDKLSPVCITAHLEGPTTDPKCEFNGSAPGMLLNIRYIWTIRCRIILKT